MSNPTTLTIRLTDEEAEAIELYKVLLGEKCSSKVISRLISSDPFMFKRNATMRTALEAIAHKITTSGKPRIEILNDCHSLARKVINGNDARRT